MDTGLLMSSIREMVQAQVMVTLLDEEIPLPAYADRNLWRENWGQQYSRHETVVREQLQKLANLAEEYKAPPRYGRYGTQGQ